MSLIINNQNIFYYFAEIDKDISSVVESLEEEPSSLESQGTLIQALDRVMLTIDVLRERGSAIDLTAQSHFFSRLNAFQEQAVFLYGKVQNAFMKYEISLILKEAQSLGQSISNKNLNNLVLKVDSLKKSIYTFKDHYLPGLLGRQIVNLAETLVSHADELLEGESCQNPFLHTQTLKNLQNLLYLDEEKPLDPEEFALIMDLLEAAELFHSHKSQDAKKKLHHILLFLSEDKKQRILRSDSNEEFVSILTEMAYEIAQEKAEDLSEDYGLANSWQPVLA